MSDENNNSILERIENNQHHYGKKLDEILELIHGRGDAPGMKGHIAHHESRIINLEEWRTARESAGLDRRLLLLEERLTNLWWWLKAIGGGMLAAIGAWVLSWFTSGKTPSSHP